MTYFRILALSVQPAAVGGMIGTMQDRRCLYCRRKIHPALRADARYCGRSCKSSHHRDKKQEPSLCAAQAEFTMTPVMSSLADKVQPAAPRGALGYVLRRQGCPLGNGAFDFPVPTRKTKHADGTLRKSLYYQLWPFEPPRIPWPGLYDLLFYVPERGLVFSADPQLQQIYLAKIATVPRAAFDEQALYLCSTELDGANSGTIEYLQREVLARAPAAAIGYTLSTNRSPLGPGVFRFPPRQRASQRADRALRDAPYYALNPFELPCVPWVGVYNLSYELQDGAVYFSSEPELQSIWVGLIFPYADFDPPAPALPRHSELPGLAPLPLIGSAEPRRAVRQRRSRAR